VQPSDRLHALDAVRAFALLLGIFLHGTMPFLYGIKGWVSTDTPSETMAAVWYVIHMFRMPVFFLLAGFFGRLLLERKGTKPFIRDRLKRIVVPLVVGLPVVGVFTAIAYVLGALAAGLDLQALRAQGEAQRAANEGAGSGFGLAHLWFLYYLAMFYAGALVLRAAFNRLIDQQGRIRSALDRAARFIMRGIWGPLILALPIAAYFYQNEAWSSWTGLPAPFPITPQLGALIGYGIIFGFGWLLHRQPNLLLSLENRWGVYLAFAVALTAVCRVIAGPTPRWEPYLTGQDLLIYTAAYMTGMWFWVFGLIGAAIRFLSSASPVRRYIADSSYWLYLMHVPALAFFHVMFQPLDWHWSVKYVLSLAGALPLLLLSYHYAVRFTFIGATLNGRRFPRGSPQVAPA
jgi:glucans biosynthesis protein C